MIKYQKDRYLPIDLEYDPICNRPFTTTHFAIWLSHVTLWEELARKSNPPKFHIIFEDDAVIEPNFVELLDKWYTDTKGFKICCWE